MTYRTTAYIDGSQMLYRAEYGFPSRITNRAGDDVTGVFGFLALMRKALRSAPVLPTHALVVFDADAPLLRARSDARYKATRKSLTIDSGDNPFRHLPWIKRALDIWDVTHVEHETAEADDVIATLVDRADADDHHAIVVSRDKDFHQLLSDRVTQWDSSRGTHQGWITPQSVVSRFGVLPGQWCDYVALVGDRADGMPGIRGIGPVTARRILRAARRLDDVGEELSHADHQEALRQRDLHRLDRRLHLPHLSPVRLPVAELPPAARVLESLNLWASPYP